MTCLALADDAAGDLSAQPAKIVQLRVAGIVRAIDPLHRETERVEIPVAGDVHGLQMAQQRRAFDTTAFFATASTTLSPLSALSGMNFTSRNTSSFGMKSSISSRIS